MSERINFNKKNNRKLGKIIIALIIVIILTLFVKGYIDYYNSRKNINGETGTLLYNTNEYSSLAQLLYAYDVEYLRIDETGEIAKIYVVFSKDLYTLTTSNQNYFYGIIGAVAEFRKYSGFEMIDTTRDIEIKVSCQDESITQIIINGDENYFLNRDSEINLNNYEIKMTEVSVQSEELAFFIENKWSDKDFNFGTKDSRCQSYDIFWDEGFKYKKNAGKVYNLIFTEKYDGEVAGGLKTTSTAEEIKNRLGTPTFSQSTLYGYVSEDCYLFFDSSKHEISIYPVENVSIEDQIKFEELINEMNGTEDITVFVSKLMDLWGDYDSYSYDINYVNLKYTLRGIELNLSEVNLGDDGLFIYQNYTGTKEIQELNNVYIHEENSIWEAEKQRIFSDSMSRAEQGENVDEQYEIYGVEFAVRFEKDLSYTGEGYIGPYFLSRDKSYPDSELNRTLVISSFKWYDDYRMIYGINDDGIYVYDCKTRVNTKIMDVSGEAIVKDVNNGIVKYNDTQEIVIEI